MDLSDIEYILLEDLDKYTEIKDTDILKKIKELGEIEHFETTESTIEDNTFKNLSDYHDIKDKECGELKTICSETTKSIVKDNTFKNLVDCINIIDEECKELKTNSSEITELPVEDLFRNSDMYFSNRNQQFRNIEMGSFVIKKIIHKRNIDKRQDLYLYNKYRNCLKNEIIPYQNKEITMEDFFKNSDVYFNDRDEQNSKIEVYSILLKCNHKDEKMCKFCSNDILHNYINRHGDKTHCKPHLMCDHKIRKEVCFICNVDSICIHGISEFLCIKCINLNKYFKDIVFKCGCNPCTLKNLCDHSIKIVNCPMCCNPRNRCIHIRVKRNCHKCKDRDRWDKDPSKKIEGKRYTLDNKTGKKTIYYYKSATRPIFAIK